MEIVSTPYGIQESLASIAKGSKLEVEISDPYIVNNFDNPELAIFHHRVGPVLLKGLPEGLIPISDREIRDNLDMIIKNKIISAFMDHLSDEDDGLMMRKLNGDTYYGINFYVENYNSRGRQDLYLLFTKCNDKLIDIDRIEDELRGVASVYASLISDGIIRLLDN